MQEFLLTTLAGGERVVSERLESVRSIAIGIWVGVGSRDEEERRAGITHFLEHLLFKGTRRYNALEIAETFDGLGGELNAATSREYTVVYARVMDEHLETALDVMTDMVFAPSLDDLDAEREVVLEEIAMVEDTPQDLVHDRLSEAIFAGHPLGRPVIGSPDVIASVSRRALRSHHRVRYAPGGLVVSAAGSVDHDELVGLVERLRVAKAGPDPTSPPGRRRPFEDTPPPRLVVDEKETEQYHVCLGAPGISRTDPRRFAASLLDGILGGSASSRLFQEIREKRGLAYSVYSFGSQYHETGELGLYVGTREENLATCLDIVVRELGDVASGGVSAKELRRAKENLKGRVMLSMESTSSRMSRLGKSVLTGAELLPLDRILAEIEAVDEAGVAELAATLFYPELLSAACIGPSKDVVVGAVGAVLPGLVEWRAA